MLRQTPGHPAVFRMEALRTGLFSLARHRWIVRLGEQPFVILAAASSANL